VAEPTSTRCLFCSLMCPLAVQAHGKHVILPAYPDDKIAASRTGFAQGRLCYRGHYVTALLGHPKRLTDATVKADGRPCTADDAVRELAAVLKERAGAETAVLVDGNLPCEDLAGAVRFANDSLGTQNVAVYLPPADEAILRGLSAASCRLLSLEMVEECDTLLAVGDPFATHPVLARAMLDAKAAGPRHRLLVLDTMLGRTSRFADTFVQVAPCAEAAALAAIAKCMEADVTALAPEPASRSVAELCGMAGASEAAIRTIADGLREAKKSGVVISLPTGRTADGALVVALAGAFCQDDGCGLLPLFTYGNAAGASSTAKALGAMAVPSLLAKMEAGEIRALLCLNLDPFSALPKRLVQKAFENLDLLAAVSPMPTRVTEVADICLPSAFWFEEEGTAQDFRGEKIGLAPVMPPPRGALTIRNLLTGLAAALGSEAALDFTPVGVPSGGQAGPGTLISGLAAREDREAVGEFTLISRAESADFADGSLTQHVDWARLMEPRPALLVNAADAAALGLAGSPTQVRQRIIEIQSDGQKASAHVSVSDDVPKGVVAVSPRYGSTRAVFDWHASAEQGVLECGPARVSLQVSS